MDYSIPPSYTEATNRDWLPLIGPYLTSTSLLSATRVSTKWHKTLAPRLWGNPASHFTTENDRIYTALTTFLRLLPQARLETRQLTHTFYLPPAPAELFYGALQNEWLRDVLDRLPGLRCLVVARISSFDHAALSALRGSTAGAVFPLKLLVASGCINCTPAGLSAGLAALPNLVFLDLSFTPAAVTTREGLVFRSLGLLCQLRVLKLRRIGLRDADIRALADALNPRLPGGGMRSGRAWKLRSLDVRDNFLTDDSVKVIIARLIHPDPKIHSSRHVYGRGLLEQDWHTLPRPPHTYNRFRGPDLDQQFIRALTRSEQGQIYLEDLESVGLTHLYLANNKISMEALAGLIRTQNLFVFDAGDIDDTSLIIQSQSASNLDSSTYNASRLIPLFEGEGWDNLTYLRINHKVVTAPAGGLIQGKKPNNTIERQASGVSELYNDNEESGSSRTAKLQYLSISEHEDQAPAYEPATFQTQTAQETNADTPSPAYRPQKFSLLPETEIHDQAQSEASQKSLHLINNRQELRSRSIHKQRGLLLPSRIPAIQTLVLTELPSLTQSTELIQNIKAFITDCATENNLATAHAQLEQSSTTRTPETLRAETTQPQTKHPFALQTIILETTRNPDPDPNKDTDKDTVTLRAAAETDFSFFSTEQRITPSNNESLPQSSVSEKEPQEPIVDVVAEIARWRMDRREEYRAAIAASSCGRRRSIDVVEGFWPGVVRIVRPASRRDGDENEGEGEGGDLDGHGRLFGLKLENG